MDKNNDWDGMMCDPQDKAMVSQLDSAPDILAVSYNSDGDTLNGTIMLSEPLNDNLSYPFQAVYHMIVQPPNLYESPDRGAGRYVDEIYTDSTGTWVRWIYEKFSNEEIREIYRQHDDSGFFDRHKRFISFSLDLNSISSPKEYVVSFGAIIGTHTDKCFLIDVTDWYQIPIPQFEISSSPSVLELRPGEEKSIEVKVTSPLKRSGNSIVTLYPQSIDGLEVYPENSTLTILGEASNSTIFNIKALDDLEATLPIIHRLVINAQMVIPDFTQQGETDVKSNSLTNTIKDSFSNLTITVLDRLTFEEQFTGFWNAYGPVISLVGGGFAAGFAAIVLGRLKRHKEKGETGMIGAN